MPRPVGEGEGEKQSDGYNRVQPSGHSQRWGWLGWDGGDPEFSYHPSVWVARGGIQRTWVRSRRLGTPDSAWLFRDGRLPGGGTQAMEGAGPGGVGTVDGYLPGAQRRGRAEGTDGRSAEPQGHPCAIGGEVQVDGNSQRGSAPGGPGGRGPRGRGRP